MMLTLIISVAFALALDLTLGDPKTKYHPTAWIGRLLGYLAPSFKSDNQRSEKLGGIILVVMVTAPVAIIMYYFDNAIFYLDNLSGISKVIVLIGSVFAIGLLLKTTIAIK